MIIKRGYMIRANKCFTFFLLFTVYYLLFTSQSYAHKVNIYAYAENGMVHSESYFVDGSKCKNSILEIFDKKNGTKLLEGKTDEEGRFSFKIPLVTSLKLVLHAGMGHQAEYTIDENEIREAMNVKQSSIPPSTKTPLKGGSLISTKTQQKKTSELSEIKGLSETEIKEIVEGVLDKKLQPLINMLVKLQETSGKPHLTEIIGGIGYIIGILGIISYFKAKKR